MASHNPNAGSAELKIWRVNIDKAGMIHKKMAPGSCAFCSSRLDVRLQDPLNAYRQYTRWIFDRYAQ